MIYKQKDKQKNSEFLQYRRYAQKYLKTYLLIGIEALWNNYGVLSWSSLVQELTWICEIRWVMPTKWFLMLRTETE